MLSPAIAPRRGIRAAVAQRGQAVHVTEASPQIRNALDRAGRFLSLASLVAVLLCSIAVAMAARRYVQRHLDSVALLKTLGASRNLTLAVSLLQLLVSRSPQPCWVDLGFVAQEWLLRALKGLLQSDLPPPDLVPVGLGFLTSIAVLGGFALPPLLQLSRVPAIRVLRRDVGPPPPLVWLAFGPAVAAVVFLIWWVVRDVRIFAGFVGGLFGFVLLLTLAGFALVRAASALRGTVGVSWRYGVANLSRRRGESVVQIVAFGLGIMVLLLLAVVRNDLLADWRKSLPTDLPNFFFINIPPAEREPFVAFLATAARLAGAADDPRATDGSTGARRVLISSRPRGSRREEHHLAGGARRRQRPGRGNLVVSGGSGQGAGVGVDGVPGRPRAEARRPAVVRRRGRDLRCRGR
jgi:putative ABC transport system permease protein